MPLPHGYTNETGRTGGLIRKAYLGPDPERRYRIERAALLGLRGRIPVPEVRRSGDNELLLAEVAGRHGQEALNAGLAGPVLRRCGELRRRLSEVDTSTVPGLPGDGPVLVHGDFGPQNLLVSEKADRVMALLDWEWCHLGAAVEDLAWAEWIVRTHHPAAVPALDELFAGYGERPPWTERRAAMLRGCDNCVEFCRRWGSPEAVAMWQRRRADTEAFSE